MSLLEKVPQAWLCLPSAWGWGVGAGGGFPRARLCLPSDCRYGWYLGTWFMLLNCDAGENAWESLGE